jgi:hypothetical protein
LADLLVEAGLFALPDLPAGGYLLAVADLVAVHRFGRIEFRPAKRNYRRQSKSRCSASNPPDLADAALSAQSTLKSRPGMA